MPNEDIPKKIVIFNVGIDFRSEIVIMRPFRYVTIL